MNLTSCVHTFATSNKKIPDIRWYRITFARVLSHQLGQRFTHFYFCNLINRRLLLFYICRATVDLRAAASAWILYEFRMLFWFRVSSRWCLSRPKKYPDYRMSYFYIIYRGKKKIWIIRVRFIRNSRNKFLCHVDCWKLKLKILEYPYLAARQRNTACQWETRPTVTESGGVDEIILLYLTIRAERLRAIAQHRTYIGHEIHASMALRNCVPGSKRRLREMILFQFVWNTKTQNKEFLDEINAFILWFFWWHFSPNGTSSCSTSHRTWAHTIQ